MGAKGASMSTLAIRRRAVACPVAVTILLSLGGVPAPAAAKRCAGAATAPVKLSPAGRERAVVCEINRARRGRGLAPVAADPRLTRMAGSFAHAMVARRFFSHVGPGGATLGARLRASGYRGRAAGEVLAWGQGRRATARSAVRAWLRSPPHRRVLLGRSYRDVGVGVALGNPFGSGVRSSATYAANFGAAR
jgi:uncharacterized protein YkwD